MGKLILNSFNKQALQFEESRFAAMAILIIFQSCMGSIAAMYALINHDYISLSISVIVTMASNAAFIALSPAKWCLGIVYTSVISSIILIVINLI